MKNGSDTAGMMRKVIGVILLGVGVLLFVNVLNAGTPSVWLALLVTLVGVFAVTAAPTAGLAMMGIGVFMLLRDFGVIETPWLGLGFSLFLVLVGLYGLFGGMWLNKNEEVVPETKVAK